MDEFRTNAPSERQRRLLAQTDQCVKCGLCLPHCPTYTLSGHEGDSPRGRIALVQGLASGALEDSPALAAHLGGCLACRSCEHVCPSRVAYGAIIDGGRAELAQRRPASPLHRLLRWLATEAAAGGPRRARTTHALLRGWQAGALGAYGRRPGGGRVRRMMRMLPDPGPWRPWAQVHEPAGEVRGSASLFLGCVARLLDAPTLAATLSVLRALGYRVRVPASQGCCGAMHLHDGAPERARALARRNLGAFAGDDEALISTASGCGATLAEYGALVEEPEGRAFGERVEDVSAFLAGAAWPEGLQPRPVAARVALHTPCTLRNVMGQADAARELLERIPALEVAPLPQGPGCCGAAGTHMLTHARQADALGDATLDAVQALDARYLATSNIGCALHLRARARARGMELEVLHPVVLVARALGVEC